MFSTSFRILFFSWALAHTRSRTLIGGFHLMIMALARDRQLLKNCDISFHGIVDLDIARVDSFYRLYTYVLACIRARVCSLCTACAHPSIKRWLTQGRFSNLSACADSLKIQCDCQVARKSSLAHRSAHCGTCRKTRRCSKGFKSGQARSCCQSAWASSCTCTAPMATMSLVSSSHTARGS